MNRAPQLAATSRIDDLNQLINGGFPLGCVILLPHNRNERVVTTVLQSFLADGVARGHSIGWFTSFKHWDSLAEALPKITISVAPKRESNQESGGLRIAWQYQRYLNQDQQSIQKSSSQMNYSLDLSRPMAEQDLQNCPHQIYNVYSLDEIITKVNTSINQCAALQCPLRLVIDSFGLMTDVEDVEIFRVFYRLKSLVQNTRSVVLVSTESSLISSSLLQTLKHLSDGVLCFNSIAEDAALMKLVAEPSSVVSLLKIERVPSKSTIKADQPLHELHLVRNKRRKLRIRQIEVDPEKEMDPVPLSTSNLEF
eukprot:g6016.t1